MKRTFLILAIMLMYLNMAANVKLGSVVIDHVSSIEINENILEMSNVAKITIPRNFKMLADKPILEQFAVGDKVEISTGYYADAILVGDLAVEFTGYIQEIESDFPLIIHCEDESYILRQTNYIKSYKTATLKQVLTDVIPKGVTFDCPDVSLGKFQIDNESAYTVLNKLLKPNGLCARLNNGHLKINLALVFADKSGGYEYVIGGNVKKNELKYKREADYKMRFKATALDSSGKKITVTLGSTETNASEQNLNLNVKMTHSQLETTAKSYFKKLVYDGYSGSITGFGTPRTHAGDALRIKDKNEPEREGLFMIEKVDITYNESDGFQRKNTLSWKLDTKPI